MEHYPSTADAERGCGYMIVALIASAVLELAIVWIWGLLAGVGFVLICIAVLGFLVSEPAPPRGILRPYSGPIGPSEEGHVSYSVSGSGHGADVEAVKEAFADFVGALDEATGAAGTKFSGSVSGSETNADGSSTSFSIGAAEARERYAARNADPDAATDDESADSGEVVED